MAEVDELRRRIHQEGYDTRKTSDGHYEVVKDGQVVRHRSGKPLRFASTPSDSHSLKNAVAQLRDAGVLPKPAAVKQRRREVKLSREQLKVKTSDLRDDVELVMLEHDLRQTDIYHYADFYASQHGIKAPSNPQGVVSKLLKGQSFLMNDAYNYLRLAVDAIKAENGQIPRAEEIRNRTTVVPADTPAVNNGDEPADIEVVGESAPRQPKVPKLTIEAARWIYSDEKDHDAIEALLKDIAILELK